MLYIHHQHHHHHHPPPPHSASCNVRMQYVRQCFYEQGHQCKLPRVTTPSASRVFALVEGRKKPPAQVAEGQGDRAPVLIGMQWETTMNASTVLVLVEQHKLEQDAATGMQLALGQNTVHIYTFLRCPMYRLHFSTETGFQNAFIPSISSCLVLGFSCLQMHSFSSCHRFSIGLQSGTQAEWATS